MPTTPFATRGPLSAAAQETIRSMARGGAILDEIAAAVGRSEQAVAKVVELYQKPRKARKAAKKGELGKKAARATNGIKSAVKVKPGMAKSNGKASREGKQARPRKQAQLLEHHFWLRSGLSVSLSLPGDLRADEAERLAEVVRALPFRA